MHCFKCGTTLPPGVATCPACGAATPYNVTASTPEPFSTRQDSAAPDNTGEEQVPPPVVSAGGETPQVERTVLQQPPQPEVAESQSVERTVLQEPPVQSTPAPQAVVERTVLQQPPQAGIAPSGPAQQPGSPQPASPSSSPAWQQPQPMQGQQPGPSQPLPGQQAQPGAAQPQQGQSWPQPFPGQQAPQQGPWQPQQGPSQPLPWPQQPQQPAMPQSYPAWQQPQQPWPQSFPGQSPQQGPWQPQPGMPQPMPWPQPPQQGQPAPLQSYPAWQQLGAVQPQQGQPWPQPFPGQTQFQSSTAWQQPQMGMAQPVPLPQAVQPVPASAAQALPVQRHGLSLERILLLIIGALVIFGGSGLIYYAAAGHSANQHAQATSVTQDFLTAQVRSMSPQGVFNQATSGKPAINDPLSSANGSIWSESSQGTSRCLFTNGAFHAQLPAQATSIGCFANSDSLSNFAFQVRMTIANGLEGGILFRVSNSQVNFYEFIVSSDGFYQLTAINGNNLPVALNYAPSPAIKTGLNQSNLLTVIARGNAIYLYINKQYITTVNDNTYTSGGLGLAAVSGGSPSADIAFSNAQVWKL